MAKDYYTILGIEKGATKDDVKKAFRRLAHQYHPDKQGGNEQKFKEINEAYQILSDDRKRAEYDTYGSTFNGAGGAQGFGGFDVNGFSGAQGFGGAPGFEGVEFDLGDIFGDFFGGGRGGQIKRGRDISMDLEIPFAEAVFGTERKILITKTMACQECHGSGGKPGTKMKKCDACNGKGKAHDAKKTLFGTFNSVKECGVCNGRGEIPAEKCPTCRGAGVIRGQEEIRISIPVGISNGEVIRLSGKGEMIPGGVAGDLYAKIHVLPHSFFKREGSNLVMDLDIKLSDAILGGEYAIETLDGKITVRVPEGVSYGEILRVRGKGVPVDKTRRGDLLITLNIKTPKKLSKKARKAVEDLKEEGI
ncbi:MAG: molecular chaperone DnaJ [Parcubacteria group bacterium]|nr:molecular chaperone DnaJ [Parcubacteria group bacterium]